MGTEQVHIHKVLKIGSGTSRKTISVLRTLFPSCCLYLSGLVSQCLQDSGQRNNVFSKFFPYSVGNEGTSLAEFLEAYDLVPNMLGSPSGLRGMTESGRQPEWSRPQKTPAFRNPGVSG